MSDDLDDLLRAAMKTLDDQVPSGYFEGLPNRTLARLSSSGEDSSMQTTGTPDHSASTGAPPPPERDEDSGLHDIRSMASSTKMRISSKRITTSPPVDDDILASSSAGWKAVALPEPAKMVSLPEIDQLPPLEAVKSERKSKKELKAERASASKIAQAAIAVETAPVAAAPVAEPAAVTPIIGARLAQQKKSRAGLYALIGSGLAAAAGVGWYVSTQMKSDRASENQVAVADKSAAEQVAPAAAAPTGAAATTATAAPEPTVEPIAEPIAEPAADEGKTEDAAALAIAADGDQPGDDAEAKRSRAGKHKARDKNQNLEKKSDGAKTEVEAPKEPAKEPAKDAKKGTGTGGDEGEPSFDALLKEAGVQENKPKKPVLDKKSLTGADIKKGMSSVAGKAQACYQGQQGTAIVKLTVAPSGQVEKVHVTGVFAGTPVGACVEAAVKGASFPQWDGGPQSFGYSYLLAE